MGTGGYDREVGIKGERYIWWGKVVMIMGRGGSDDGGSGYDGEVGMIGEVGVATLALLMGWWACTAALNSLRQPDSSSSL